MNSRFSPARFNECLYQIKICLNREFGKETETEYKLQYHSCVDKESTNTEGLMAFLEC